MKNEGPVVEAVRMKWDWALNTFYPVGIKQRDSVFHGKKSNNHEADSSSSSNGPGLAAKNCSVPMNLCSASAKHSCGLACACLWIICWAMSFTAQNNTCGGLGRLAGRLLVASVVPRVAWWFSRAALCGFCGPAGFVPTTWLARAVSTGVLSISTIGWRASRQTVEVADLRQPGFNLLFSNTWKKTTWNIRIGRFIPLRASQLIMYRKLPPADLPALVKKPAEAASRQTNCTSSYMSGFGNFGISSVQGS